MNARIGKVDDVTSAEWDSYDEFKQDIPDLVQEMKKQKYLEEVLTGSFYQKQSWLGTDKGFFGALEMVDTGWPKLLEMLEPYISQLDLDIQSLPDRRIVRRRKRRQDDHGDTLQMTRVWNGQLDKAWDRMSKTPILTSNQKRVTLFCDVCTSAGYSFKDTLWRAALCMRLMDELIREGRNVEVWVGDSVTSCYSDHKALPRTILAWCVKRSGDPVVMDRLAIMTSVTFLRTAAFAARAVFKKTTASGLGYPSNLGLPYTLHHRKEEGEAVIRIGGHFLTRNDAFRAYRYAMEEANQSLEEV